MSMDNTTAIETGARFNGQVKFFDRERGFGFVTRLDDKVDFFVHFNDIQPSQKFWSVLYEGEYVEFGLREGPNGIQASKIKGIGGGTLLCEHNFNVNKKPSKHKKQKNDENTDMETCV